MKIASVIVNRLNRLVSIAVFGAVLVTGLGVRAQSADAPPPACEPACRSAYICNQDGKCVSECNPPCEAGTVCRGRECVAATPVPQAAAPQVAPRPPTYPGVPAEPEAAQYGYFGAHPIPWDQGSGFCTESGPHFHAYAPFDKYLFRESQGFYYFVGDVGDFGYNAETWGYHGHHPIPLEFGGGWCYIDWDHRHAYAPRAGVVYNFTGGYYIYAGSWDPVYYSQRDYYRTYYGGYYRTNYYGHRYYETRPHPVYRATPRPGTPGAYKAGETVRSPGGHPVVAGASAHAPIAARAPAAAHPAGNAAAKSMAPAERMQNTAAPSRPMTPADRMRSTSAAPQPSGPTPAQRMQATSAPGARPAPQPMVQNRMAAAPAPAAAPHPMNTGRAPMPQVSHAQLAARPAAAPAAPHAPKPAAAPRRKK